MASPLAVAMMGGSGENSGLGVDPAVMAAMPDIQLGQALMQGGLSTAPASPWQALARVAQTGAGSLIQQGARSQLAQAYTNTAENMAQAIEQTAPGHPLIAALRSPDPTVRMAAMQQAGKVLTLLSEPQRTSPGQDVSTGKAPVYQNTGPQSPQGKVALDQTRATGRPISPIGAAGAVAGAEAAGRAPYEPGGEGVVNTPSGPQTIPLTADTRSKIQPGVNVAPSAAIPPPEPAGAPSSPTSKDQSRVPQPAGPSSVAPAGAPAVSGRPLANPAVDAAVAADTKELAGDRELATKGQQDMATVKMIQDFLPKVQTGWSADSKLEAARILKAAGTSDAEIKTLLNTDVASGQILQKKFLELSAAAARGMGAREPGSVISMFAKAYPNLGTDPQAVALQTNALYMDRLRQQNLASQKTNFLNESINGVQSTGQYRGLKGFNEQFNKSDPAEKYLSAAEAMSGVGEGWKRIKDPAQQQAVIDLIPPGTTYMAPDGTRRVHP